MLACYRRRSVEFALWKLGYEFELDREEAFRKMFLEAMMRFTETGDMRNKESTAKTAKSWSEIALAADDRLSGGSAELRKLLGELQNIGIQLGARAISSLDTIKAGKADNSPAAD